MALFFDANQKQFRGRNDDGTEATATWIVALNTNWTQDSNKNFRVRFTLQADAGVTNVTPISPSLYYSLNGGAYTQVTSSSNVVRLFTSANVTDATATTQQISGGLGLTYLAGSVQTTSSTGVSRAVSGGVHVDEDEWCLQIRTVDVANSDTITLQERSAGGGAFVTYTVTPSITVNRIPLASGNFMAFM